MTPEAVFRKVKRNSFCFFEAEPRAFAQFNNRVHFRRPMSYIRNDALVFAIYLRQRHVGAAFLTIQETH